MIDKQKLLQWIEEKVYVLSGPYDNIAEENKCKNSLKILRLLERDITDGDFDAEDEEEFRPRFKMDAVGNLTLVEDDAE